MRVSRLWYMHAYGLDLPNPAVFTSTSNDHNGMANSSHR